MNRPLAICSAALFGVMLLENYGLKRLYAAIGFSNFMIFCVVAVALLIAIGYGWDAIERSRSRGGQPPKPRDFQPLAPVQHDAAVLIEHQSKPSSADRAQNLGPTKP